MERGTDRVVYVVSDLHLGPGWLPSGELEPLEDFSADEDFARFLHAIGTTGTPVELVIAGDFLEYCQTLPEIGLASPEDHLGSTEAESIRRTRVILGLEPQLTTGHPRVFQALRRFMMEGNSITIIAGNHDIDLLWDGVWALVFDAIYPPGSCGDLRLVEYSYELGRGPRGRVYIEHGHEHDRANRFGDQMHDPFGIDRNGVWRLKRCWGTLFVDKVYNQLERERWFIDNVKPILRVVRLGLRNDFLFTATAVGLVVRFLMASGLPPVLGGAEEGPEGAVEPDAEAVAAALGDPALQAAVRAQLDDPAARAEFEAVMRGADQGELRALLGGGGAALSLDDITVVPGGEVVLGGGGADDVYRIAAAELLERDPSLSTVIMGHTHTPIDGYARPITLADGRQGYFFNSGTWTPHLRDEDRRSYSWAEIGDAANYTTRFTYIKLEPDGRGGYRPLAGSWFDEER
ncbi:MAG TPA: metallophosphoesterase [Chloroflexaceae bacterium]|nr:metallophosphoesterase [Chloroflexaceae bacterium]